MKGWHLIGLAAAPCCLLVVPLEALAQGCVSLNPLQLAANAGAGYTSQNGQFIGPDGKPFTARGVDVMYGSDMPSGATLQSQFPGINFVRLAVYQYESPQTLAAYVNDLTSHGIVTEIEDHNNGAGNAGGGAGGIFTGAALQNELSWYSSVAAAFKGNPNVWFGTNNEPSETDPATGQTNAAMLSDWQLQTYQAIRGAGNNNPILLEANGWSENGQPVMLQGYNPADYASMKNVGWDAHYYGWLTNYSTDQQTNNNFVAQMVQQVQQVKSADGTIPVVIGEYGPSTQGANPDGNAQQVLNAVQSSGLSAVAWTYGSGNPGSDYVLNNDGSLSAFGQTVANFTKNGPSGCFATTSDTSGGLIDDPHLVIEQPPANLPPLAGPDSDYWSVTETTLSDTSQAQDLLSGFGDPTFQPPPFLDEPDLDATTLGSSLPPQVVPTVGAVGSSAGGPTSPPLGGTPPQVIPTIGSVQSGIIRVSDTSDTTDMGTVDTVPAINDPTVTPDLAMLDKQSYGSLAVSTADQLGVNPASLAAIAQVESGFRNVPTANGSTSAVGPWQFTQGTFDEISSANNLGYQSASLNDPNAQAVVASYYLDQIATTVSTATGQPATTLQAYGGWLFGATAGAQLANATNDTPLSAIVSDRSLANNGMSSWTVGDFRSAMTAKLGSAANQTVMTE